MAKCPFCQGIPDPSLLRTLPSCSHSICANCLSNLLSQQNLKCPIDGLDFPQDFTNANSFPPLENPEEEERRLIERSKEKFGELQGVLDQKTQKLAFDLEVFFNEEKGRSTEAFQKNQVFNEDINGVLAQLYESELTPEFIEAYEREEQLDYDFENNGYFVHQQQAFQQAQKDFQESLKNFEDSSLGNLKKMEHLKPLSPELLQKVVEAYKSEAEAKFMIIRTMGLFKLKVDDEDWLIVSPSQGNEGDENIPYEKVKNAEKLDIRMEGAEYTDLVIFGINFWLENCLEKVSKVCLSLCRRFISNQEARKLSSCAFWGNNKIKSLTVDFTECTVESDETPLILLKDGNIQLESLEGFKLFLKNTNATEKTVNDFGKLIVGRMKNLQRFGLDFHNLYVTDPLITSILLDNLEALKNLHMIELDVRRSALTDHGILVFAKKVLPHLKNLQELRLWLGHIQLTDQGLSSLFKSVKENCASRLKAFLLGLSENNVSDESFKEFACDVLPLMENIEEFKTWIDKTSITDKSLVPLCQNIKFFAPKLKIFALGVESTEASDETINALAVESIPLMKKVEVFYIWFSETKITDVSMINLYTAAAKQGVFSGVQKFELDSSETAITDESLKVFAEKVLPTMGKLREMTFYSNKTKLEDASLRPFFMNLAAAKAQLNSVTVSLDETDIGEQSILGLAETLPALASMKNISIWLNKTKLGDSSLGPLCLSLKSIARNLECLDLCFNDTQITDKGISVLGDEVAAEMRIIKELRLWMSSTQVGDAGLRSLFTNLKGTMATMKVLQMCLYHTLITDESIKIFAEECLSKVESLQLLELWAAETKISDLSMVPFLSNMKKSSVNMSKLVLSLQGTRITDETYDTFNHEVMANLQNLKELQLLFGQTQVSDNSIIPFFKTMVKKVQGVRSFELGLNDVVTETGVMYFARKVLKHLKRAQDFKLFWSAPLSDPVYRELCLKAKRTIKNIKTWNISNSTFFITTDLINPPDRCLKELHFELSKTLITDDTMREILLKFEDQVSQVKSFSFMMNETGISRQSLMALADTCFSFMVNLESLKIDLNSIQELPDAAFCYLCRSLKQCAKNLKFFKIDVGITTITDASIVALAEHGIAHMTNLETLELYFLCNIYLQQALTTLFTQMQHAVKKLQGLILYLPGMQLPKESIEALATHTFPNLQNLVNFNLTFYKTMITDEDFSLLFSGLKGALKTLKSFILALCEEVITDKALDTLSNEALPLLTEVENFKLWLSNAKIGNESFIRFSKKLQAVGGKITDLLLNIEKTQITDDGVNEFALNTLPVLKKLKNVDLKFGETGVTDVGIGNLFSGLAGSLKEELSSLNVSLQKTGLTDVGIVSFKEEMAENLERLEKFSVDFSGNHISEDSQFYIADVLSKFQ